MESDVVWRLDLAPFSSFVVPRRVELLFRE